MYDSSFEGVSRFVWMATDGVMIRAEASRYQKNVDEGWSVMAWRMAGTRDQVEGDLPRVY
jgi:hypothetical protein